MAELSDTIERIRSEEASIQKLFSGDGGEKYGRVRVGEHRKARDYKRRLTEAAVFIGEIRSGKRPLYHLQEAMSTSDFPILFADILDRQLLANYAEIPPTWQNFARRGTVPDFRTVRRFAVDGAETVLPRVGELEEYREASLTESRDEYSVGKVGRRLDLSWEALINDDLDAFRSAPERLARAARRSEEKFATELYIGTRGPNGLLYEARYSNVVTGNPPLELRGLQLAFRQLYEMRDAEGEPVMMGDAVTLFISPALVVTAENLVNALSIELEVEGGSREQRIRAANWMRGKVRVQVVPYLPIIARENADTTWGLFGNPNTGRPALEVGFLRGYEEPALFERLPNARRVGGSGGDEMRSFEDDSRAWRVTHVFGGTRLLSTGGTKATVASNGSGA